MNGSRTELTDRVLTHASGNLSTIGAVEHKESPSSCEDDTSSESSARDSDNSSNDSQTYVEQPFGAMFVTEEDIQQANQVGGNQWEGTFFQGGGGLP